MAKFQKHAALARSSTAPTGLSSFLSDDSDEEKEKFLKLKAHVIDEMFDKKTVRGVERNILFLSNAQAGVCTQSPDHMQKLLEKFPMHRKPKMVINLCVSKGFSEHVNSCAWFTQALYPGLVANNPPFTEEDRESEALERLDRFMADIILPLAVETNALIFCSGISKMCVLTSSLTRVVAACGHRWLRDMPFTMIYTTPHLVQLFASDSGKESEKALFWRELAQVCKPWKDRLGDFQNAFNRRQSTMPLPSMDFDLDERAVNFLIVDSLGVPSSKKDALLGQCGPYNHLMTQLVGLLWRSLPVLALKTGGGDRAFGGSSLSGVTDPSTLQAAYNFAAAGMPVLWIDMRKRKETKEKAQDDAGRKKAFQRTRSSTRDLEVQVKEKKEGYFWTLGSRPAGQASGTLTPADKAKAAKDFIENAMKSFTEHLQKLEKKGKTETLDACSIAYFRHVCETAQASSREVSLLARHLAEETFLHVFLQHPPEGCQCECEPCQGARALKGKQKPRWQRKALGGVQNEPQEGHGEGSDAGAVLSKGACPPEGIQSQPEEEHGNGNDAVECELCRKACKEAMWSPKAFGPHIEATMLCARLILSSPKTYQVNLHDNLEESVGKKLRSLATANRLPQRNPQESAPLLRKAWRDFKVAMRMADIYKRRSKILTAAQLLNGWLIIFVTALSAEAYGRSDGADSFNVLSQVNFGLASVATIIVSCNSLLNTRARWQQLRLHACQLKGLIWRYRTRVEPFHISASSGVNDPEIKFREEICRWRYSILSAADLESTTFEKEWARIPMEDCPDEQDLDRLIQEPDPLAEEEDREVSSQVVHMCTLMTRTQCDASQAFFPMKRHVFADSLRPRLYN